MKIYRTEFFSNFKCLKGDCPVPCCHGWQIPVDPESYRIYRRTKGKLGLELFFAVSGGREFPVLNASAGSCHFYTKDGLCGLRQQKGEAFLPGICRRFPAKFKNYGYFCEESLELACPACAELFLSDSSQYLYREFEEEEVAYPDTSTNDDPAYLKALLSARQTCLDLLSEPLDPSGLFDRLMRIRDYSVALQKHCLSGSSDIEGVEFPAETSGDWFDLFDVETTDHLMCSGIYHIHFKKRLPLLYELCRSYFNVYDSLTPEEGNRILKDSFTELFKKHPDLLREIADYFCYYLESCFLTAYEDYSFMRTVTFGLMHVHFLLLFYGLYEETHQTLTPGDRARIIASYERHARHNDELLLSLWEILGEEI